MASGCCDLFYELRDRVDPLGRSTSTMSWLMMMRSLFIACIARNVYALLCRARRRVVDLPSQVRCTRPFNVQLDSVPQVHLLYER